MSAKKNSSLIAVGADDGFFNTKLYLGKGNELIIPSRARLGAGKRMSLMGSNNDNELYEYKTNDLVFTVGASESDTIVHDEYPTSDLNRVLVHHALRKAGLSGADVALRTGLPLRRYYLVSEAAKNEKLITKKENNFKQQVFVHSHANEHTANIKLHNVGPEAASFIYDYVIEESDQVPGGFFEHKARLKETIAIIDIGGKTTDICVMEAGDIVLDSIETINAGMHNIYDVLRNYARDMLCLDRVQDKIIDRMFKEKTLKVGSKVHDVEGLINETKSMVASDIIQAVNHKIGGKARTIDCVAFIGGGSDVLASQLKNRFDNEYVVTKPVMANARGLYKALVCGILPNYQG